MNTHRNRLILFVIILVSYLGFGGYYAFKLQQEGIAYKHYMEKSVNSMGSITRLGDLKEWVDVVLPIFNAKKNKEGRARYYEREALEHYNETIRWSYFFASVSIGVLIITLALYLSHFFVHGYMAMMMIAVSMVCLWVGISSPMMEIYAYNNGIEFNIYNGTFDYIFGKTEVNFNPEFEGKLYHYYQNKSVIDLIYILFEAKNVVVAVAILLFSIVFPITKLIISFMAMAKPSTHNFWLVRLIIHKLGKWSMADVFVAASFLSYLSFQNMSDQVTTDANTLPGMYYFISFSMLSITSSYFVELAVKRHDQETERLLIMQMQPDIVNPDVD